MSDDSWTFWGTVYDRHATLDVVKALQAKGHHVRVVKVGNHNDVYVDGVLDEAARS